MLKILILRNTGTLGKKQIRENLDSFTFEKGTYYPQKTAIFLKKGILGYKPHMLFVEGYSLPLDVNNVQVNEKEIIINGKKIKSKEPCPFIDSFSIHKLTDRKLLGVLASGIYSFDIIVIILLLLITVLSIGNLII